MSFILAVPLFLITDKIASRLSFIGLSDMILLSFICPLLLILLSLSVCRLVVRLGSWGIRENAPLAMDESVGVSSKESRGSSYAATSWSNRCASREISSAFIEERTLLVRAMERMLELQGARERVRHAALGDSIAASMRPTAIASIRFFKDTD